MKTEKRCPGCGQSKPVSDFVTIYGYPNPRGKYCEACFRVHQQEHAASLMDGLDFCLYCGMKIDRYCDWGPDGRSLKAYLNQDHMDPVALGGANDDSNLVYCCVSCNHRKKDRPFASWLAMLDDAHKALARAVYVEKHGHQPEEFVPNTNASRSRKDVSEKELLKHAAKVLTKLCD